MQLNVGNLWQLKAKKKTQILTWRLTKINSLTAAQVLCYFLGAPYFGLNIKLTHSFFV